MELNENLFLEYTENDETEYAYSNGWKKVDSKEVKDSDGFMTEYTWYTNDAEDTHIFIFGDSDIYGPDDSYADAEFDSYDLAKEWFDNYYGFDYDEEDPDWVEFAEDRPADDLEEEIKPNIESEELKALAQKHNIKILDAMSNGDLRMEGAGADLMKFYQEAEKLGLWQVDPSLYECNNKVTETLTMHNFDEFNAIADEVGLITAEDLERFRKEEMQPGESELDAIKRYKQELIDAGVDLSKLVNESLQEGAVKEVAMDIEAKEKELADLKGQLDQLKSYDRKECGAGGPYDSTAELDAEISDVESAIEAAEKELAELKAKVNG